MVSFTFDTQECTMKNVGIFMTGFVTAAATIVGAVLLYDKYRW